MVLFTKIENARKVQIYVVGVGHEIESLASKEELQQKNLLPYLPSLFPYLLLMYLFSDLKWKIQAKSKDRLISSAGNNDKHIYKLLFTSQTRQLSAEKIMSLF